MSAVVAYVVMRESTVIAVFSDEAKAREFADAQADNLKEDRRLWTVETFPFNPAHW